MYSKIKYLSLSQQRGYLKKTCNKKLSFYKLPVIFNDNFKTHISLSVWLSILNFYVTYQVYYKKKIMFSKTLTDSVFAAIMLLKQEIPDLLILMP